METQIYTDTYTKLRLLFRQASLDICFQFAKRQGHYINYKTKNVMNFNISQVTETGFRDSWPIFEEVQNKMMRSISITEEISSDINMFDGFTGFFARLLCCYKAHKIGLSKKRLRWKRESRMTFIKETKMSKELRSFQSGI